MNILIASATKLTREASRIGFVAVFTGIIIGGIVGAISGRRNARYIFHPMRCAYDGVIITCLYVIPGAVIGGVVYRTTGSIAGAAAAYIIGLIIGLNLTIIFCTR